MDLASLIIAALIILDSALAVKVAGQLRQRAIRRKAERARYEQLEAAGCDPQTPRARGSLYRAPSGDWRTVEAAAAPSPTLAMPRPPAAPPARRPASFEDRCGQAIADVLSDAKIAFRPYVDPRRAVPLPVRSARTLTFFIRLDRPSDLEKALDMDERLAMLAAIDAARVARYGAKLGIEFQLPAGQWHTVALDRPGAGCDLRLGQNTLNQAVHLELGGPSTPHALIAGTTGCGKTTLLQTMLYQIALADPADHRLLLIDSKAAPALRPFHRLPHLLAPPAVEPDDALRVLSWTAGEIMRRRADDGPHPALTLAVDEIALLVATARAATKPLATILSVGREMGVRVVAGTQKVTTEVLGNGMLTANFPVRLAGYVTDANESRLATGQPGLCANRLSGKGDFLAVAGGQAHRFTAAMLSEIQVANVPRAEVVADQLGDVTVEALGMIETLQVPTSPAQYAAVLAAYTHGPGDWPGINKVAQTLNVGKERAERIRAQAQELTGHLERAGVGLCALDSWE